MNEITKPKEQPEQMILWAGSVVLSEGTAESTTGKGMISTLRWIKDNIEDDGLVEASLRKISLDTGKSTGTVQSSLAELKRSGFLTFVSGSGRQTRKYIPTVPVIAEQDKEMALWAGSIAFNVNIGTEVPGIGMVATIRWLVDHLDPDGLVEASLRNISLDTGKSTGTIQSSLAELKRSGFLVFVSGSGRQTRKYHIAIPE